MQVICLKEVVMNFSSILDLLLCNRCIMCNLSAHSSKLAKVVKAVKNST